MDDLGRYQRGQRIILHAAIVGLPDDYPTLSIAPPDGSGLASFGPWAIPWGGPDAGFNAVISVGPDYALGRYTVTVSWTASGVSQQDQATFDVVGGGDSGGPVISLYAYDRPEGRYVLAQLGGGKLVQGRNPKL